MSNPYPPVNGSEPCRRNPELWFESRSTAAREATLAACRTCHVIEQCRTYALTARAAGEQPVSGVWGGTTGKERDRIRAELGISLEPITLAPHGSLAAIKRHNRAKEPLCAICRWEDSKRRVDAQQHRIPA